MDISVVIPTRNRKDHVARVLQCLASQDNPIAEIIVVDASDNVEYHEELTKQFPEIGIKWIQSESSVCIQRNVGIQNALSEWIFLCDDDIQLPSDYLSILTDLIRKQPQIKVASGVVLQDQKNAWVGQYPVTSSFDLLWRSVFQLSIWGEIKCPAKSRFIKNIINRYESKGNHLTKAGWPVIIHFSRIEFQTPLYGLGAALIKKELLVASPFDEVLDPNGIGDNYGVIAGFPSGTRITVTQKTFVKHHLATENRLNQATTYYRRVLALDYFIRTKPTLKHVKQGWLVWSLVGNGLYFLIKGKWLLLEANSKAVIKIIFSNPYFEGKKRGTKKVIPQL